MNDGSHSLTSPEKEKEFLLAQIVAAATQLEPERVALFDSYVRLYFEQSSLDTLRLRAPDRLAAIAHAHFVAAQQRSAQQALVSVRPPADDAGLAIVDTCVPDSPFLVDTVGIAVRAAATSVDWAVHPVLRVRRNAQGEIQGVDAPRGAEGLPESWIHMEFEALRSDEAYSQLQQQLSQALEDLRTAVGEGEAMRARAHDLLEAYAAGPAGIDAGELSEARAFLEWILEDRFVFLASAETTVEIDAQGRGLFAELPDRALGLARPGRCYADTEAVIAPREELNKYVESPRLVVVTKGLVRSHIHAPELVDIVSVKRVAADGSVLGTTRFIGLFSSDVYIDRPLTIPLVRRKVAHVLERARFPANSFSGRALREIMHLLPRDELFQSSEQELYDVCMGIRALGDRQQLKLFMRRDRYGRSYSCMVFLPRERYTRELRDRVVNELTTLFDALSVDRSVEFLRGGMARIRCVLRTHPGMVSPLTAEAVEQRLVEVTRSWREQLREVLSASTLGASLVQRFGDAFPLSYTESVPPIEAAADLQFLSRLSPEQPLLPRLMIDQQSVPPRATALRLYSYARPVMLSDVLPTLENFGLRVLSQDPVEVHPRQGEMLWIEHFSIEAPDTTLDALTQRSYFEAALLRAWSGEIENDGLNRLVLAAGLSWRQVTCLRAIAKYINQVGLPYGRTDIERLLADHAAFAASLVALFEARFDPALNEAQRTLDQARHLEALDEHLDRVTSLDADRVLRCFVSVVRAGLRTNFFQTLPGGGRKSWVSIKLNPSLIGELPMPRPMFEIWVYAPEVEGVHLRGGYVARGGLRWSDRREDFRTEILGLMKAQMVKNAVIVPVGAKGGFVVKKPVDPAQREAWMQQGIACYKTFLRGLLDITDNQDGAALVAPADVVRHDSDDPYLVVAADKGTASFSDIANGVSQEYGFWLGDAFASGGSRGYDHKKMGITARGAWESVKRHFREMVPGRDIQAEPFTVVGIGDMSGDVFGNGMLLSQQTLLVAAFDHRHIFLDPHPDAAASFAERQRLFALPRSSWADYTGALISAGGGVFARNLKSIAVSPEVRQVLGIAAESLTPNQLIGAILRAPVDLLWNGGIGTYVKASQQANEQVGDRSNDAIRINGRELRCKVVGEGGNLGFTQLGRIEYALNAGRINSDAIDNCAGVHTSDREVNIKIPLNRLMREARMTQEQRDPLLGNMTGDIAALVLYENYIQPACISMEEREASARLDEHVQLMRALERDGLLDRGIEFLPDDETLKERRSNGHGLTRPELGVLVAYAKIALYNVSLTSSMPDDRFFERDLLRAFPQALRELDPEALKAHRLRREIIATILANAIVDRMGISFAQSLADDHGMQTADVLKAYAVAHEVFDGDCYWRAIEALDNQVSTDLQYRLMQRPIGLLKHSTGALVGARRVLDDEVGTLVQRYRPVREELEALLPGLLPPSYREEWDRAIAELAAERVPEALAHRLTTARVLGATFDIAELVQETGQPTAVAAQVYFLCGEQFRMLWLLGAIRRLQVSGQWERLARNNLRDDAWRIHYLLTLAVLRRPGDSAEQRLSAWMSDHERPLRFALTRVQALQSSGAVDFMGLAVAVRELRKLRALE